MNAPYIQLASYNPVGNGIADDSATVQSAINAAIAQGAWLIGDGKPHAVHNLQAAGTLRFDGMGARLILDSAAYPDDTILFSTVVQGKPIPFTGSITRGSDTLACGSGAASIAVDSLVKVWLGTDPYDSTQPNLCGVCTVLANNAGTIGIDRMIPNSISGTSHWIAPITTPNNGSEIRNVAFDYTVAVENVALWIDSATNFVLENISGRCGGVMVQATYCDRGDLRNVSGDLQATSQSGGRLLGGWQNRNIKGVNLVASLQNDSSAVFLESWCQAFDLDLKIDANCPNAATNNLVHITGGSTDIRISNLTINSIAPVLAVGSGGEPSDVMLGDVVVDGPLTNLPVYLIDGALSINGQRLLPATSITRTYLVGANWSISPTLCVGAIRKITVDTTAATGLTNLEIRNIAPPPYQGTSIMPGPSGMGTFGGSFGNNSPWNKASGSDWTKILNIATGAKGGGSVTISVDYWPAQ